MKYWTCMLIAFCDVLFVGLICALISLAAKYDLEFVFGAVVLVFAIAAGLWIKSNH